MIMIYLLGCIHYLVDSCHIRMDIFVFYASNVKCLTEIQIEHANCLFGTVDQYIYIFLLLFCRNKYN